MARKVPPLSDKQIKATQPKDTAFVLTDISDSLPESAIAVLPDHLP